MRAILLIVTIVGLVSAATPADATSDTCAVDPESVIMFPTITAAAKPRIGISFEFTGVCYLHAILNLDADGPREKWGSGWSTDPLGLSPRRATFSWNDIELAAGSHVARFIVKGGNDADLQTGEITFATTGRLVDQQSLPVAASADSSAVNGDLPRVCNVAACPPNQLPPLPVDVFLQHEGTSIVVDAQREIGLHVLHPFLCPGGCSIPYFQVIGGSTMIRADAAGASYVCEIPSALNPQPECTGPAPP